MESYGEFGNIGIPASSPWGDSWFMGRTAQSPSVNALEYCTSKPHCKLLSSVAWWIYYVYVFLYVCIRYCDWLPVMRRRSCVPSMAVGTVEWCGRIFTNGSAWLVCVMPDWRDFVLHIKVCLKDRGLVRAVCYLELVRSCRGVSKVRKSCELEKVWYVWERVRNMSLVLKILVSN